MEGHHYKDYNMQGVKVTNLLLAKFEQIVIRAATRETSDEKVCST